MVSEKVGGAEGTKLDDDFRDLERVREHAVALLSVVAGVSLLAGSQELRRSSKRPTQPILELDVDCVTRRPCRSKWLQPAFQTKIVVCSARRRGLSTRSALWISVFLYKLNDDGKPWVCAESGGDQ